MRVAIFLGSILHVERQVIADVVIPHSASINIILNCIQRRLKNRLEGSAFHVDLCQRRRQDERFQKVNCPHNDSTMHDHDLPTAVEIARIRK
jgi:hypothetical protein